MRETPISYQTAKLAKDKGYTSEGYFSLSDYYNHEGVFNGDSYPYIVNARNHRQKGTPLDDSLKPVPAPSQSLLQKWLRDVHKIHVEIDANFNDESLELTGYCCLVYSTWIEKTNKIMLEISGDIILFPTYEEALEEGLINALKLIK